MRIRLLLFALLLCTIASAASYTYTGFYTGQVIPTPQKLSLAPEAWDLGRDGLQLLLPPQAGAAERIAAETVANRIRYLTGRAPAIREVTSLPSSGAFIALGLPGSATTPDRPEGYVIRPRENGTARGLVVVGRDAAGLTFAAQTVVQLFERQGSRLLLHPATVRDWPVYRLRSFKTGGAYDPGGLAADMAAFAPFAKFNCYNICYTTLGADKWVNPPAEYRQFVTETTRAMRERGLDCMPFVNPYYLWKEHIETSDEGDLVKLFEACRLAPDAGGTRVMLCLDDFASEPDWKGPKLYHVRSKRDRERWGDDLAAVNLVMINDLARRLRAVHPECKLYVVPPYYWTPSGSYREDGEANLRRLGQGLDPSVTVVWTGPRVRSATITREQVEHYQGLLGGRKTMLWDNTIYMHHNPPHYLLDTFHTKYADSFWDLTTGEVHLNTGGGPIYQCGVLSAGDFLWNPQAFDPDKSLRNAIAALAGPEQVDALLAFRDAFYAVYDGYAAQFGKGDAFLAKVKSMTSRPFDEAGLAEVQGLLDRERTLADQVAATCPNQPLAEEIQARAKLHDPYREAFALLAKLPPLTAEDGANLAPNPDAEQVANGRPASWGLYTGAGDGKLDVAPGRNGGSCGRLTATKLHDWGDGRQSINVALMIGDSNGFIGLKAPAVLPLHGYYYSFWIKGAAPRVVVSFVTWDDKGGPESRVSVPARPEPLTPTGDWTFVSGQFVTPLSATHGCLKINLEGYTDQGGGLGDICVDDVYVGRSRAASLQSKP